MTIAILITKMMFLTQKFLNNKTSKRLSKRNKSMEDYVVSNICTCHRNLNKSITELKFSLFTLTAI